MCGKVEGNRSIINGILMTSQSSTVTAPEQLQYRGYIGEFDGLRALGLTLVLINHFVPRMLSEFLYQLGQLGWIAMDSFFVMSGFLITGILLDSREKPRFYRTFYARRALRIFPLYYVVLLLWWVIIRYTNYALDYQQMSQHWGSPLWFVFYAGNIRTAWVGAWPKVMGYVPLWSLQIEEQFYLLFPLAVGLLRREHLRWLLIGAAVASPVFRVAAYLWQPNNPYLQYALLPCHCEGIALGGLIAIRFRSGAWNFSKLHLTLWTALLMGAAVAGSFFSRGGVEGWAWANTWNRLAGYSISSLGCACLVLWLISFRGSVYTQWMRIGPLKYLGKISYGVYLLHPLALWTAIELGKKRKIHFLHYDPRFSLVGIGLSLLYAAISWHFFEGPILKMKERFTNFRKPPVALAVPQ